MEEVGRGREGERRRNRRRRRRRRRRNGDLGINLVPVVEEMNH